MPLVAGMWDSYVRRKGLNRATAFDDNVYGSFGKSCLSEEVLSSCILLGGA